MAGDFYTILGVKRNASKKEIQAAYRRLARKHHPDVTGGDKASEELFKRINEAHELLGDEKKRAAFDKWGDRWMHAEQLEEAERQGAFAGRTGGPGGGGRFEFGGAPGEDGVFDDSGAGFGNIFDRLFRGAGAVRAKPKQGQELRRQVVVSLAEAFQGSTRTLQVQTQEACDTCGGNGVVGSVNCHACQNSGRQATGKRLEITIPAGVETGTKIRLRGKGGFGLQGGPPGDVVLEIEVADDPRFERRGAALHTDVAVPLITAVLGGETPVGTVTGPVVLNVPAGTQNGRVFRLGGKGMPVMSTDSKGDLFAKVRVVLPEQIDDDQRALFERLRDLEGSTAQEATP
jgi:molecular chaperone DnaJ